MMISNKNICPTPWDKRSLLVDTYEIANIEEKILKDIQQIPGHFTVKLDPLSDKKKILHQYGFYYCDTLIEPYVNQKNYKPYFKHQLSIKTIRSFNNLEVDINSIFQFDRFHRDFNINVGKADLRYKNWLNQLIVENTVYLLKTADEKAGFIACKENKLVLHALSQQHQGKGLAKYFWSLVCNELFERGCQEITSSISAANLPAVNLYASLGFKFRHAQDIYHKLII